MVSTAPLTPRVFRALFDPSRAAASVSRAAVADEAPDIYQAPLSVDASKCLTASARLSPADFRAWCVRNRASGSTAFRLIDEDWASLHALGVSSWVTAARFAMMLETFLHAHFCRANDVVLQEVEEDEARAGEVALAASTMALFRRTGTPCALLETGGVRVLAGMTDRPDCAVPQGSAVRRSWPLRLATCLARQSELPTDIRTIWHSSEGVQDGAVRAEHGTSSGTMHATIRVHPVFLFGSEVTDTMLHELHHWRGFRDLARDAQAIAVRPNERRTLAGVVIPAASYAPVDFAHDPELARLYAGYRAHWLDEIPAFFLTARVGLRSARRCRVEEQIRTNIRVIRLAQILLEQDLSVLGAAVAALRAGKVNVSLPTYDSSAPPRVQADRVLRLPSGGCVYFHSAQLNRGRSTEDPHDWSYDPLRVGAALEKVVAELHALQPRMAHTHTALEALLV